MDFGLTARTLTAGPRKDANMDGNHSSENSSSQTFLNKLSYALLPGHCVLCKSPSERKFDLCKVCEEDLPHIGRHCKICSIPLVDIKPDPTPESAPELTLDATLEPGPDPHIQAGLPSCGNCLVKPPPFTQTLIPFSYRAPVDKLIWEFKFNGNLAAGKILAVLLTQYIQQASALHQAVKPDVIIPVPLHWRRRFSRGFNQAYELSKTLGKSLAIDINKGLVKRTINTPRQLNLNHRQRLKTMRNSFAISASSTDEDIVGKTFAIVDDVVTTTSTVGTIAKLLVNCGAARVVVWAVARTALEN